MDFAQASCQTHRMTSPKWYDFIKQCCCIDWIHLHTNWQLAAGQSGRSLLTYNHTYWTDEPLLSRSICVYGMRMCASKCISDIYQVYREHFCSGKCSAVWQVNILAASWFGNIHWICHHPSEIGAFGSVAAATNILVGRCLAHSLLRSCAMHPMMHSHLSIAQTPNKLLYCTPSIKKRLKHTHARNECAELFTRAKY